MNPDTMSMRFQLQVTVLAGSPVYIGTGPSEGTLWGAWNFHLWPVLDPATEQSWGPNVAGIIDLRAAGQYLEVGRGYIRLGEVIYGGTER